MPLVDYGSDSDSDSAPAPAPPPPPAPAAKKPTSLGLSALLPKPKTRPVPGTSSSSSTTANPQAPRKIIVQLPKSAETEPEDGDGDGPPNKRARTAGTGGGLNALLPAPKRSGAAAAAAAAAGGGASGSGSAKPRVLGGAAARKEDENLVVPMGERMFPGDDEDGEAGVGKVEVEVEKKQPPPVVVGRKTIVPMSALRKKGKGVVTGSGGGAGGAAVLKERVVEKVSLFGSAPVFNAAPTPSAKNPAEYKPLLVTTIDPTPEEEEEKSAAEMQQQGGSDTYAYAGGSGDYGYQNYGAPAEQPDELETMARQAGLDDAALRQLRGRGNRRNAGPIKIVDFNVDAEYNENEHARAMGLAEQNAINPVRSIAPGKHQLTSLLNAAQAQRGALEEHFAQGKRNKKEAGAKYGW